MAIQWRDWGSEAFAEAKALDRLIVLSISANWCHWCHVMDRTSWAESEVQEIVEREFVPIRVNTDRRPDINQRYNLGGWPTTAILTPTGEVLTGGTYFPPEELKQMLRDVVRVYHSRKTEIYSEILKRRKKREELLPGAESFGERMAAKARSDIEKAIMRSFDPVYGGFGVAPKFPAFDPLEYCLNRAVTTGDERFRSIVIQSLKAMVTSEIWDSVEGGFFRYATQEDWTRPHYEKMLEDNCRFVEILARAGAEFSEQTFRERARQTLDYLHRTLRDPESEFYYGSQDASEEYYAQKDLESRRQMGIPEIDRTAYVGWNAQMARALVRAGLFLEDSRMCTEGIQLVDRLMARIENTKILPHCWNSETIALDYLEDYLAVAEATLEAFEETGDAKYAKSTESLLNRAIAVLWDSERGSFRDTPLKEDAAGQEKEARYPLTENARFAILLGRWAALTEDESALDKSRQIVSAFQRTFVAYGIFAAPYAEALYAYEKGIARIAVIARNGEHTYSGLAHRLVATARKWGIPAKVVIPPSAADTFGGPKSDAAPAGNGSEELSEAEARVCIGNVCHPPVGDPEALRQVLSGLAA